MASQTLFLVVFDDHEIFIDLHNDKIAFTLLFGHAWLHGDLEAAMGLALTPMVSRPVVYLLTWEPTSAR